MGEVVAAGIGLDDVAAEARALVVRTTEVADQRASLIALTHDGRRAFTHARQRVLERLSVVTAEMTIGDVQALAGLYPVLVRGMDAVSDSQHGRGASRSTI